MDLSGCFKAYDVRGRVPGELNTESVYRIGRAYADWLRPHRVAVGRDIRHSSRELTEALIRGLNDSGVNVVDIGLCGTECVYFATFSQALDGGIERAKSALEVGQLVSPCLGWRTGRRQRGGHLR